jgi:hypothetical protein
MSPGAEFELYFDGKQCPDRLREGIGIAVADWVKRRFPNCQRCHPSSIFDQLSRFFRA